MAENTIVVFTADNGAMVAWFPDAGTTPFRGEKATTWEGGVRVPMLIRWPARIKAGKVSNGIQTNEDIFATLAAAAGVEDVRAQLKTSHKVMIDGENNLAHWTGTRAVEAQRGLLTTTRPSLTAIRIGNWKSHFMQREGFFDYNKPSALLFNLRMDPFEKHDSHHSQFTAMRLGVAWGGQVQDALAAHMKSLREFPPRQTGGSLRMGAQ